MEDMTFVVKSNYDHETIFKHSFSDAHSSPEYFGKGFKKIYRNNNENKDKSLEEQFHLYSQSMNTEVSFLGGGLDDRDMLNFLDPEIIYDQYFQRTNFLRYNFFKDFHHTVHAAWQLYCLYHDKPDLIKRWQVFGNHETLNINQGQDKKNTCAVFVSMMSQIRRHILPTEIDFINEEKSEIISLSHAFGGRYGLTETHAHKEINRNFSVMYLKSKPQYAEKNLKIEGAYGNNVNKAPSMYQKTSFLENSQNFLNFADKGMNPQLWTDYRPDLNDLLQNKSNFSYQLAREGRGYDVKGNINEVLEWRKKIVLDNFQFLALGKQYNDFRHFHIFGYTHGGDDTTKLMFESKDGVFSFSNLLHFAKDSGWLFTACSCHNTYGMDFTNFTSEKKCFFDCSKPEEPISVFETVNNYDKFLEMSNKSSEESILPLFIDYLKKAVQAREATTQGYNTAATKISELEKKITFSSNLLTPQLGYFGIPGVGFLLGSKFKKYKKQMYLISAVLSGIKLTYFVMNARRKTAENKKALVAYRNGRDFFSKSLKENKFMDQKRKKLLEQISEKSY